MIEIVDYGMGNLRSVQKAFEALGHGARFCAEPERIRDAEKLVLPGVGAFRDAIREINERHLDDPIREHIVAGKPFLGICLGLQLLFDTSYEEGEWPGLGIVPGEVVRFDDRADLEVPHMGWNHVEQQPGVPIFAGLPDESHFYFVHSYHVVPRDESVIVGRTDHGGRFVSVIARDNLFATQFHPEKSQNVGRRLLENFAAL